MGAWGLFDRLEAKNCAISLESPAIKERKKFQKFISIIEINEWNNWGITQVCGVLNCEGLFTAILMI